MAQTTATRPPQQRKPDPRRRRQSGSRSTLPSMGTLASWQLRTTWRLLLVIGLGILAAVVLVCAIPLYVQVALSAGIRHTLASDPSNLYVTVNAQSQLFSSDMVHQAQDQISSTLQADLGSMVASTPALSVEMNVTQTPTTFFDFAGTDVKQAPGHIKLLQGRLPAQTSGDTIEFAAIQTGVRDLHLTLNKVFTLTFPLVNPYLQGAPPINVQVKCEMVGIIAAPSASDLYWHGQTFQPQIHTKGLTTYETLPVLSSNSEMMSVLDKITQPITKNNDGTQFAVPPQIDWYYNFDFSHLDINQLPDLISGITSALTDLSNSPQFTPYVVGTTATGPLNVLQGYGGRVTVVDLPTTCLAFLIAALTLLFALLMTDVLIERQVAAIALLRSRGASARQVFGALLSQGLGLSIIAFVAGPLLAVFGTIALVHLTLSADGQAALGIIADNPVTVAQGQIDRDSIVVGLALLGIILSIWRALRGNVLVLQREMARSTHKPFWMRFNLDILAAVVALAGFGFSLYLEFPGVLDVRTHTLILPLTSLVGVVFLLVACLLLFLRCFPALLRFGERLAGRNRGAAPVLALAQMARSPRQSLRMVLLFALAVAFALFTLIFSQTQAQRLDDITKYQVGSDFTGAIPALLQGNDFSNQMAYYSGIKGVTSVTLGMSQNMVGGPGKVLIAVNAMDAHTYAQTMYWTAQDGSQSITSLMATLRHGQAQAEQKNVVPAIIDDAMAQTLGIGVGQQFVLSDFHGPINFTIVAVVHYLPTTFDSASSTGSGSAIPQGGILVDYQTFTDIEMTVNQDALTQTNVWLRTKGDPSDLANVRANLLKGMYALDQSEDRRALLQNLGTDPLYGAIQGIMILGALVVLLLGLVGNLMVSWWNARSRRTNFAILRALGCAPGQIVATLLWEQGIVYGFGLLLGVILSVISALVIVPAFIFSPLVATGLGTTTATAEDFYVAQIVPAVQVVTQPLPILALIAALVVICILALFLMVRVVIRPQVSQTLRLEED